jgi:hypothetical protein
LQYFRFLSQLRLALQKVAISRPFERRHRASHPI